MNKLAYTIIFSRQSGQLVVVGENASRSGKSAGGERGEQSSDAANYAGAGVGGFYVGVMRSIFAAGLLSMAGLAQANTLDANALPTGAVVQAGTVSHSTTGSTMNIVQTTNRAVVNYNSFNIGSAATVNHTGGVMLARVTGAGASQIQGTLNTSGMVLINPNGIAIGSSANINAGSFTASTLNVTDDNFMDGNMVFERNGATGSVINAGTIKQLDNLGTEGGGYVALVGASVSNSGTITTQGGDVIMAAADKVTINAAQTSPSTVGVPLSQRVRLELAPEALQSATVDNSGLIVTEGGHVLMRAAAIVDAVSQVAQARVTHSGSIDTTGTQDEPQGGRVDILADHGTVRVSGSITANSTDGSAGGDIYIGRDEHTNVLAAVGDASGSRLESQGGFVETSGDYLVTTGTRVRAKDWLLDPTDITIVESLTGTTTPSTSGGGTTTYENTSALAASQVLASDIVDNLNDGTNVTIKTVSGGTAEGLIRVAADIVKTSSLTTGNTVPTLTLDADGRIFIDKDIRVSDNTNADNNFNLVLKTGNGGVFIADGVTLDMNNGDLTMDLNIANGSQSTMGLQVINRANIRANNITVDIDSARQEFGPDGNSLLTHAAFLGCTEEACVNFGPNLVNITAKDAFTIKNTNLAGDGIVFGRNLIVNANVVDVTSTSQDAGIWAPAGRIVADAITLNGTSTSANVGVAIYPYANLAIRDGSTGGITITGASQLNTSNGVEIWGVLTNNGTGDTTITSTKGHINLDFNSSINHSNTNAGLIKLEALDGSITLVTEFNAIRFIEQRGNAGIQLLASGNVSVPLIRNVGTGDVVIAAGKNTAVSADGAGGQVLTIEGNSISNNGKTLIYTGSAAGSGNLGWLRSSFSELTLSGADANTQLSAAYNATPLAGVDHQVFFRQTNQPTYSIALNDITKVYGDADPADLILALINAYQGPSVLTSVAGLNTFSGPSATDVINSLTGTRAVGENVGQYAYTLTSTGALANVSLQPQLNISPRTITLTGIQADTKVYDGNANATITFGIFDNLVLGESLKLTGTGLFNSPNVNDVTSVSVANTALLTRVDDPAMGLWSNYQVTMPSGITSSNAAGLITAAPLQALINPTTVFATQLAVTAIDQGVSFIGFVNGENADVLNGGTPARIYLGDPSDTFSVGLQASKFGLASLPTADNYQITVTGGDLRVIPADRLLITVQSQAFEYGAQSETALGLADLSSLSAVYCLNATDCNGANLVQLNVSSLSENRWRATDNTGSFAEFTTSVSSPQFSTGRYLNVGNYNYSLTEIQPYSRDGNNSQNFLTSEFNGGVLTVNAAELTIASANEARVFTGSTLTQSFTAAGLLFGDQILVSGLGRGIEVGSYQSNLTANGADRANYRIAFINGVMSIVARQTHSNRPSSPHFINPQAPVLPADAGATQASASIALGGNPFQLAVADMPDMLELKCNLEDLTNCRCDPLQPVDMQRTSLELETTQVCYQPVN